MLFIFTHSSVCFIVAMLVLLYFIFGGVSGSLYRTPVYRLSKLQIQEENNCVTDLESGTSSNGNCQHDSDDVSFIFQIGAFFSRSISFHCFAYFYTQNLILELFLPLLCLYDDRTLLDDKWNVLMV